MVHILNNHPRKKEIENFRGQTRDNKSEGNWFLQIKFNHICYNHTNICFVRHGTDQPKWFTLSIYKVHLPCTHFGTSFIRQNIHAHTQPFVRHFHALQVQYNEDSRKGSNRRSTGRNEFSSWCLRARFNLSKVQSSSPGYFIGIGFKTTLSPVLEYRLYNIYIFIFLVRSQAINNR
jgi:hypothetical protein